MHDSMRLTRTFDLAELYARTPLNATLLGAAEEARRAEVVNLNAEAIVKCIEERKMITTNPIEGRW